MIVVLFLLQFIVGGGDSGARQRVADSFVGYSLADLIVRLLVAPLSALAAAVMFFELKALHSEPCWPRAERRPPRRRRRRRPERRRQPARRAVSPSAPPARWRSGAPGRLDQEPRRESPPDLVLPIDALFARGADALGSSPVSARLRVLPPVRAS